VVDWNAVLAGLTAFFVIFRAPLEVLAIILGAVITRWVLLRVIRRVVDRIVSGVKKKHNVDDTRELAASPLGAVRVVQRTRSLGSVFSNAITGVIVVVASLLVFTVVIPEASGAFALITAAVGAGLGFGAQNIVKDVLNGIFMISEDQLGIGDVVDLGPATGIVEDVGIRITQVRDVNGTLWFVRNGEVIRLGNMSHGWARVIIDLAIPYDSDVEEIQEKILAVATELAGSPKWRYRIIEKPALWGIESISAEAIIVRLVIKTRASAKDDVAREFRLRLKKALDEMGVRLPSLLSVIPTGAASTVGLRSSKSLRAKTLTLDGETAEPSESTARATRAKTAKSDGTDS